MLNLIVVFSVKVRYLKYQKNNAKQLSLVLFDLAKSIVQMVKKIIPIL